MKDKAEIWLKKNDPLYINWHLRSNIEAPYLSQRQMRKRIEKEIPASNWIDI
jgi:hypothetical protein